MPVNRQNSKDNSPSFAEDKDEEEDFKPLSAEEAQQWRRNHRSVSIWWLIGAQLMVSMVLVLCAALVWRNSPVTWSVAYGALVVLLPAGMFARGMVRQHKRPASMAMLAVWELAKILFTVALLVMAPRMIAEVHWLALVVTMILVLNVYWVAFLVWPKKSKNFVGKS